MSKYLRIYAENPQLRLIKQAVAMIRQGAVIAFPTDSCYALGCHLGEPEAQQKIRNIRQLDKHHHFTLMCRNLSELGSYAQVSNRAYRLLRAHTPGPYTYILPASRDLPRRLHHPKRKTIGLRVPRCNIIQTLLQELDEPLLSATLIMPEDEKPLTDTDEIITALANQVDLVIDGGHCGTEPTTVIDLETAVPQIFRIGKGDPAPFKV